MCGHEGGSVEYLNTFNLIAPKNHSQHNLLVGQKDIYGVAGDTECAWGELNLGAGVKRIDQTAQKSVAVNVLPALNEDGVALNVVRIAHAIEA